MQKSPNSSYKNKKKKIGKRKLFSKSKTVAIKKPTKEINCNVEVEAKPEAKTEVENGIEDDVEYEVSTS